MLRELAFDPPVLDPALQERREEVRRFLAEEIGLGRIDPGRSTWTTFDADFSRRCGERGYIGITWPRKYGGREASAFERHVIIEELIAGGAPLGAHWTADRQSGPQIMRHATDRVRDDILPKITAGACYFGIGMSEPDTGSDLASVRTRATKVDGGWQVNGRKIWTTNADKVHYLIALVRTSPAEGKDRRSGLTQLMVELTSPGIDIRPIDDLKGGVSFNEITFDDVFVPDHNLLGEEGQGWKLVTSELAYERSGPDRFLSNTHLLMRGVGEMSRQRSIAGEQALGDLLAQIIALRSMSLSVAAQLERGTAPNTAAALVKDVGTRFEQEVPDVLRRLFPADSQTPTSVDNIFLELLADNVMTVPSHTLRGGTTEVLRSIVARGIGLR